MTEPWVDTLLYADGLHKLYPDGNVQALNGVTFGVHAGEYVAITGPSGCGKSTLLNVIGALDRCDQGMVYFQSVPLSTYRDLARFRSLQIGFVFQSFFLLPTLTSQENVQVPMFGRGLDGRARRRKADELLEQVGMTKRARHLPVQLSVGERQRVAVARALANDPPLLLADEPTGNLDTGNAAQILDLLMTLQRDRGMTLVVVTHSPEVATRANRVISMRDGKVIESSDNAAIPANR
jgi:putative ABC transport system ATP-binding protein